MHATTPSIGEADLESLLATQSECTLCWTNRDGHPVSVTCTFVFKDGFFWMMATLDRVRSKALRRDPRAALTISSIGTPLGHGRAISYKGNVEVQAEDEAHLREVMGWLFSQAFQDQPE